MHFLRTIGIENVIDIGANLGQFSLLARHFFPGVPIVAFEPLTKPSIKYRSVFKKDPMTRLVQAAIGSKHSHLNMHVSRAVDSSSLLPIGHSQIEIFPGTEETHQERVMVAPLDAFIPAGELSGSGLLKIDVQGYELEVLQGCESLIDKFAAIYIECSFIELYEGQALAHEVIEWLHLHEFYLARIGIMTFDRNGMSVQGDFLFLPRT